MNLILTSIRIIFYICLPLLILCHGAVAPTVYTAMFSGTTVMTILCSIYWLSQKKIPAFSNTVILPAGIFFTLVMLQVLSTGILITVSDAGTGNALFPFTADIYTSIRSLCKAMSYVCLLLCFLTAFHTAKHKYHFVLFFCFIGFTIALFALIKMILQQYHLFTIAYYSKGFGPYINRNHYAGYMTMVIPACWAFTAMSRERSKKILGLFFTVITTASLLLSLSRGGILAMLLSGFCIALLVHPGKNEAIWIKRLITAAGLLGTLLFVWWIGIDPILRRLATLLNVPDEPSFLVRLWWSIDSLGIMKGYPFFGTGLGTLRHMFGAYKSDAYQYYVDSLHNDYFQFITECGCVGFALLLFSLGNWIKTVFFTLNRPIDNERMRYIWMCSLAAAIALGVHSFVDFNLHIPANCICFLLILTLPFDCPYHTIQPQKSLLRDAIPLFLCIGIQAAGTLVSIDMLRYDQSIEKALAHSAFTFQNDLLQTTVTHRPCYAEGYYALGKGQFYESLKRNDIRLLKSAIANLEQAIRREPRSAKSFLRIGVARYLYAQRHRNDSATAHLYTRALADLHHAVRIDRTNGMFWYFYGSYLIKNWYDNWEKEDTQWMNGLRALGAAISFRPAYLPQSFEKIAYIDPAYTTLSVLLTQWTSIKMIPSERLKRTGTLHALFARMLKKHMAEIDFGVYSKSDLLISSENLTMAESACEQKNYTKALLLYERVTKTPCPGEQKIRAHTGMAACLRMLQAEK